MKDVDVGPYRGLEPDGDWPFFDSDCSISEDERAQIWPLSEAGSCAFWEAHVSAEPLERHPMLLPANHWLAPTIEGPNWLAQNRETPIRPDSSKVGAFLSNGFRTSQSERVYFVLMREHIYSAPMDLFVRYWPDFLLLGDENAFLYCPDSRVFARFGPNGQLSLGHVE